MVKRYLVLENGSVYSGNGFGAETDVIGEVVFTTGMTGYQETITDPSYCEQIIVFTYPMIGNYGINKHDFESLKPQTKAIIVKEIARRPTNYNMQKTLTDYAVEHQLVGLADIDTRALTKELRDNGVMRGIITDDPKRVKETAILANYQPHDQVQRVTTKNVYQAPNQGVRVAVIDFGLKQSILKALAKRQAEVIVFPATVTLEEILKVQPDGILLSNGPGNPVDRPEALPLIQQLQHRFPLMGICLGHQLFALANGAKTYKMKFGHRGFNHAVFDKNHQKTTFTSQNHGYAVDEESLKATNLEITHQEINDHTIEGVRLKNYSAFSVQFHPDAAPGPHDAEYLFDDFIAMIKNNEE